MHSGGGSDDGVTPTAMCEDVSILQQQQHTCMCVCERVFTDMFMTSLVGERNEWFRITSFSWLLLFFR